MLLEHHAAWRMQLSPFVDHFSVGLWSPSAVDRCKKVWTVKIIKRRRDETRRSLVPVAESFMAAYVTASASTAH
jgi:hypothetical protein